MNRPGRETMVSSTIIDHLLSESVALMLRNHDDSPEQLGIMYEKLELMGFHIGTRYIHRVVRPNSRLITPLEKVSYVVRDFFTAVFRTYNSKLQTDNAGVFVVTCNDFNPLKSISSATLDGTKDHVLKYLVTPCGIIRGALNGLGLDCDVNADSTHLPHITFVISVRKA